MYDDDLLATTSNAPDASGRMPGRLCDAAIVLVPLPREDDTSSGWDVVLWVRCGLKRRGYSHLPCAIGFLRTAGEKLESGHPALDGRGGASRQQVGA